MPEILLGAGAVRLKKLSTPTTREWDGLITVDFNEDHKPDVIHDLTKLPLPFEDNFADQIHAYDVMEHLGQQGDWRFFFDQWADIWRVLKPGGLFFGISPHHGSQWAWGDPGHTRLIGKEQLLFLSQPNYVEWVGSTPMTDYRFHYRADFDQSLSHETSDMQYQYVLRAVKPSRIA